MTTKPVDEVNRLAQERIAELGAVIADQMAELVGFLHKFLAESIEEIRGDQHLLDLLYASIESNIETLVHIVRHGIPVEDVSTPAAAEEYARRLAQRGISATALVRAYRLGQQAVVDWAYDELTRREPDPQVAFAVGRSFTDLTFRYIDSISEQVVVEYETERERWLANRSTVRAAMLEELIAGEAVDASQAEQALGYRLRQHHLGAALWGADLRQLEQFLQSVAKAVGSGHAFFIAKDRTTASGWVPLGREGPAPDLEPFRAALEGGHPGVMVAFGSPGAGMTGFRTTHLEAWRAHRVAVAAGSGAGRLTSYADPDVRTAAMLAADLDATRRLVANALGGLAADSDAAARLRDTLGTFLSERGSYTATAERVHLHKNTVKYRVDKAVEERGRPLDEDRLELELALVACRWLGTAVLRAR